MTKRIFSLLLLLISITLATAQKRRLNGQIVEKESKQGIPYATLIIKNTAYGVQADEEGKYLLELPAGYEQDSVVVSSLSYEERVFAVTDMTKNQRIELAMNVSLLGEVVVYPIDPLEIIKKAVKNRNENHDIEKSTVQQSFNRELFFEKGACFRVGENMVDIYTRKLTEDDKKNLAENMKITTVKKVLKARGIQDSTKLWILNDTFKMKHDTISIDEALSKEFAGFDITGLFDNSESEEKKDNKKSKKKEINLGGKVSSDFKYNGTVTYKGRTTHRILVELLHEKKVFMKGQLLIDSATYAFSDVSVANQNMDLFKEFVPWYVKGALRLLGYKPVFNRLSLRSSYAIGDDDKWYKTYDYFRWGGSIRKRGRTLDGYVETECFYGKPKPFEGDFSILAKEAKKAKDFKEEDVASFDDNTFWQPREGYPTPDKVKKYVDEIHRNNQNFKGSIGYNKKESRKKRREERRKY